MLGKRVDQIVYGRIGVARRKGRKIKPEFQQLQNRDGLVLPVVDVTTTGKRRDDDSRNAGTGAPTVASDRRRNVVPPTTILIVRHNDRALVPHIAVLHSADDVCDMLLPSDYVRITGMFVVDSRKLDECDRRQPVVLQVGQELGLVLQVRIRSGGVGIERGRSRVVCVGRLQEWSVFRVIRERLMMELKYDAGSVAACVLFWSATFQPPEYHFQVTPASSRRLPIVTV